MIVMERRPNALEKYERPESKSDGYQQRDDRKTKKRPNIQSNAFK